MIRSPLDQATASGETGSSVADFWAAIAERRALELPKVEFWWRDDDLITNSDSFQRLSDLSDRFAIGPLVAIIPGSAVPSLSQTIAAASRHLWFAQHGLVHANHEGTKAPSSEFGSARPTLDRIRDIAEGRALMLAMDLPRFLDVFVPPWNRIDPCLLPSLARLGFIGLSGYESHTAYTIKEAECAGLIARHTCIEVLIWSKTPRMRTIDELLKSITSRLREFTQNIKQSNHKARDITTGEPFTALNQIGILTHHAVMNKSDFRTLETLFQIITEADHCEWKEPNHVFA